MFGYIKPYSQELLVKEYELYRAAYCGVCRCMQKHTGRLSSLTLSYDIVFLAFVRLLLEDEKLKTEPRRCIVHCSRKRLIAEENDTLVYCAKISAILGYGKLKDDIDDGNFFQKIRDLVALPVLARAKKLAGLNDLGDEIFAILKRLDEKEKNAENGELCADLFGEILGLVFSYKIDEKYRKLAYDIGYHTGRFIYFADAAEDFLEDCKRDEYNPYRVIYKDALTEENKLEIKTSLTLELEAIAKAVELLPYNDRISEENIIKNTVYFGMPKRISFLEGRKG